MVRVYLCVKTCEVFLCFVAIVKVRSIMLTSLFCCFTSLVSVKGSYTEDKPEILLMSWIAIRCPILFFLLNGDAASTVDETRDMVKTDNSETILDDSYQPQRQDYYPILVANRKFRDVCFYCQDP